MEFGNASVPRNPLIWRCDFPLGLSTLDAKLGILVKGVMKESRPYDAFTAESWAKGYRGQLRIRPA